MQSYIRTALAGFSTSNSAELHTYSVLVRTSLLSSNKVVRTLTFKKLKLVHVVHVICVKKVCSKSKVAVVHVWHCSIDYHSMFYSQVLLHANDYATITLYTVSSLLLAVAAMFLPIETKGKSLKVRKINVHFSCAYARKANYNSPTYVHTIRVLARPV